MPSRNEEGFRESDMINELSGGVRTGCEGGLQEAYLKEERTARGGVKRICYSPEGKALLTSKNEKRLFSNNGKRGTSGGPLGEVGADLFIRREKVHSYRAEDPTGRCALKKARKASTKGKSFPKGEGLVLSYSQGFPRRQKRRKRRSAKSQNQFKKVLMKRNSAGGGGGG